MSGLLRAAGMETWTRHVLPYDELDGLQFERMCMWLLENEGLQEIEHNGLGGFDGGCDLLAWSSPAEGPRCRWLVQCKRRKELGPADVERALVQMLAGLDGAERPAGVMIITSATVSATARTGARELVNGKGVELRIIARTELDVLVKKVPRVLEEFFGISPDRLAAATSILSHHPPVVALTHLPASQLPFVGRDALIERLVDTLGRGSEAGPQHIAITGMPGLGKSALADQVGRAVADRFEDGVRFIDLGGHGRVPPVNPGDAALALLLAERPPAEIEHRAHTTADSAEARIALWQEWLFQRQVLVVLDNAADATQVASLLPQGSSSAAIVTSRRRLELPTCEAIPLDVLEAGEAAALLLTTSRRHATDDDAGPIDYLLELCGGLPLAVVIVAAKLRSRPTWTFSTLADTLSAHSNRLEALTSESVAVAAAFAASYDDLAAMTQRTFQLSSLIPGLDFDRYAVSAVLDVSPDRAAIEIDRLAATHLVRDLDGRYSFHDLLHEFASKLGTDEEDPVSLAAARQRLHDSYEATAQAAVSKIGCRQPLLLQPARSASPHQPGAWRPRRFSDAPEARAWFGAEMLNLLAVAHQVGEHGPAYQLVNLAACLAEPARWRGPWDQAAEFHRRAAQAAQRLNEPPSEAQALIHLGMLQQRLGAHRQAADAFAAAIAVAESIDDPGMLAFALNHRGTVQRRLPGEHAAGVASHCAAIELYREIDSPDELVDALCYLTICHFLAGDYDDGLASGREAFEVAAVHGYTFGEAYSGCLLGSLAYQRGEVHQAIALLTEAIAKYRQIDHQHGIVESSQQLAIARSLAGETYEAERTIASVVEMQRELGNMHGEASAHRELGVVRLRHGDVTGASQAVRDSLELHRLLGAERGTAEALTLLGFVLLHEGKTNDARTAFGDALQLAYSAPSRLEQARAHLGTGLTHEPGSATWLGHLRRAEMTYAQIGSRELVEVRSRLQDAGLNPDERPTAIDIRWPHSATHVGALLKTTSSNPG